MLSLIVFGVVALIVIVFLVVFNVRAMSGPENARVTGRSDHAPSETPGITPEPPTPQSKVEKLRLRSQDDVYRNALRQFHSPASKDNDSKSVAESERDAAYRAALRTLKEQNNKD